MTDKQIIEEDMVNAKDFCPYFSCEVDCYEARMCQWFVDTLQQLDQLKAKNEELKKELQKYKDDEQQEKEMQKLYNKFNGNSLIEKCNPTKN